MGDPKPTVPATGQAVVPYRSTDFDDPEGPHVPKVRGGRPPPLIHTVLLALLCVPPVVVVIRLLYRSQELPFSVGSPLWIAAGVMLAIGVAVCLGSVAAIAARSARGLARLRHRPLGGQTGWLADYRWDPAGVSRGPVARWMRVGSNTGLVFWLAWQPIYLYRTLWQPSSSSSVYFGLLVFALPLTWFAYRLLRFAMGGTTRVTFVDPPYSPHEPIVVYFGLRGAGTAHDLSFELRCVREAEGELPRVVAAFIVTDAEAEIVWAGGAKTTADTLETLVPDSDIELTFEPPPGLPGTRLSRSYPIYWELLVQGETNVGRYEDRFLIPVYAV